MKRLLFSLIVLFLATIPLARAEMQGAWISSVYNINFPAKPGLSVEEQKSQAVRLLDAAKNAGLNAVLLQVRPESDALYASPLEPWSRFLTGTQGQAPGYDPLAFFTEEARKRGLEVHAWINPYRAATNVSNARAASHISRRFPQYAYRIGTVLYMDPGSPEVRRHINAVVRDLVTRYDIAGVHLDDYFYPYPAEKGGLPNFPDDKTYASYRSAGGRLAKADWRRENVNTLIRELSQTVHSTRPGLQFGVSPFGIYTKGAPADVKAGVDQYNELFSDPVTWMRNGWVDYLAPQLYWRDQGPQSFSSLLRWWRSPNTNPRRVPIIPGIAVDRLSSQGWEAGEIHRQLILEKNITPRPQGGFLLWNIGAVLKNTKGIIPSIKSR
ncbi:MAG: family 10 glycosylhydrolase [bacterium]